MVRVLKWFCGREQRKSAQKAGFQDPGNKMKEIKLRLLGTTSHGPLILTKPWCWRLDICGLRLKKDSESKKGDGEEKTKSVPVPAKRAKAKGKPKVKKTAPKK